MIKFLDKLSEVNGFIIKNRRLYWISNDKLFYEQVQNKIESIDFPSNVIYLVEGLVFSGKNFYFDTKTFTVNIIEQLEGYYYANLSNEELFLFSGSDLVIYNHETKRIEWKQNYIEDCSISLLKESYFITYSEFQIECYDFICNATKWKLSNLDLCDSSESFFSPEIILHQDKLFINVISNGNFKNYIVDIFKGHLLKEYSGLYGQMFLEKDLLYFLSSDDISILNIETEVIETFSIRDIFESTEIKRLQFPKWTVQNGLIYFTQSGGVDVHSGSRGAIFGTLDPKNMKILWHESLPKEHGLIGDIQVENERIYIHTQDKTLFVFEL